MKLNFREMRNRAGYTLETAADRMGLSPSQVSRIESGTSDTSLRRTQEFAQLYGCTAAELIRDPKDGVVETFHLTILKDVILGVDGFITKNQLDLTSDRKAELIVSFFKMEADRLKDDPTGEVDLDRYQSIIAALT
ncbi:hypothetical protein GCM10011332_21150 [Terasakiella brassicae]|uniref:HTH cro/C1-type domain-containing protein n=1 Tax=Terasakiella brassicae TaxID=1634917 RepID=A0A917C3U2_9PROT|nr:helix-turn-helix transcriptional regulator [Terasakiella brassicae]GGF66808.1 hypothetical protein GCM10011332_21150 [Terasakiella brassicae]